MSRYINNWMRWWKRSRSVSFGESLRRFVNCEDRPHPNPLFAKGGMRGVKQRLLVSLLTVVIISACSRTAIEHSEIPTSKPLLTSCRVVQQAIGEVCVPHRPQRILTLFHHSVLGHVLVLEVKPIGSSVRSIEHLSGNYLNDQTYLGNKTEGIKQLGIEYQIDLEKI
ncbi:MAG: hypothetical protein RMY29_010905 [Nostoc sp. CreGUA01]|nr:hypothetical protein [Nostoc sp. CreGUA01]